ncbi:SDR family NAD(P)-dependent oxidoreductase [Bradyrhizobium sp. NAS80.1]|uniref:SDR family NAD(P)-dependent oxidoreductase n=1 Tax=Bradyrhizobium sp. NAS80.1 TaxID=1680159 RepID=UPI0024BF3482|nr:SDR family NAD(P)-dependent oxidoreductase [Bradyrhizobium sp. NAS80.1]
MQHAPRPHERPTPSQPERHAHDRALLEPDRPRHRRRQQHRPRGRVAVRRGGCHRGRRGSAGRAARATVKDIEAAGGRGDFVQADVTSSADVRQLVATIVERHDGLHVAFNNAGTVGRPAPTAEPEDEVWSNVFAVNTTGIWLAMKYEIAHMRANGGGTIVNCSSNIGFHGRRPGMSAYAASKAAVSVLTRNAAREYIADGVRISGISPGATDTPLSFRSGEDRAARDERGDGGAAIAVGR